MTDQAISRRAFLFSASASAAALALSAHPWLRAADAAPVASGDFLIAPSLQIAADGESTWFTALEVPSGRKKELAVPIRLGHSWAGNPADRTLGVVPESGGGGFVEIDLRAGKVTRRGEVAGGQRVLGGHADFSRDGKTLFLTEADLTKGGEGFISVRDGTDFKESGKIPTHGKFPHEMYVSPDGKTVLVANLGMDPITFARIELQSGKLLETFPVRADRKLVDGAGGELSEKLLEEASYYLQVGDRIVGPRKGSFVLHPHGNAISFWDLREGKRLKRVLGFGKLQPVAITLTPDRSRFAVCLSDASLVFFKRDGLVPDPSYIGGGSKGRLRASTHLFSWSLTAKSEQEAMT